MKTHRPDPKGVTTRQDYIVYEVVDKQTETSLGQEHNICCLVCMPQGMRNVVLYKANYLRDLEV